MMPEQAPVERRVCQQCGWSFNLPRGSRVLEAYHTVDGYCTIVWWEGEDVFTASVK